MSVFSKFECERKELDEVLSAGLFVKSPNLAKLLSYVCNEYFEGRADDLKEYQIAVQALGRPADFDPALTSIVRVEMHRLRGRLKRYYEEHGTSHSIQIMLEAGSYAPRFVKREASPHVASHISSPSSEEVLPVSEAGDVLQARAQDATSVEAARSQQSFWQRSLRRPSYVQGLIATVLVLLIGGAISWKVHARGLQGAVGRVENSNPSVAVKGGPALRILCGFDEGNYVDRSGNLWGPDRYFTGGEAGTQPQQFIARTLDPTLFQTSRHGEFSYDTPLPAGTYELRLYFSEVLYGPGTMDLATGEGNRVFDVTMNGKPLLTNFDIIADAGANKTADVRVFKDVAPAPDGYLHLQFRRKESDPAINAIEIEPRISGKMQPIRIVAQDNSYTDIDGNVWHPDNYFSGGRHSLHKGPVMQTPNPGLYSGERFGNFSYEVPVADGKYTLVLHFAETFFGPENLGKGQGGVNSRTFDVICNGKTLLHNLDIFKESGGENIALVETFRGLSPNARGKLDLEFKPINNYATVSAIEVFDESD